jgi:hypothetical protein
MLKNQDSIRGTSSAKTGEDRVIYLVCQSELESGSGGVMSWVLDGTLRAS